MARNALVSSPRVTILVVVCHLCVLVASRCVCGYKGGSGRLAAVRTVYLVFRGPVRRTEKNREPDWTEPQSGLFSGCSCLKS
jgi:hypothetical protein